MHSEAYAIPPADGSKAASRQHGPPSPLPWDAAGLKKEATPFGTVSLAHARPKAIMIEEADIPVRFWVTPPPVQPEPYIDEKALLDALLACSPGQSIAGAQLANGGFVVSIRRQ
ncbi:MAG: hypothetical protein WBX25_19035 [Rhodomicrobium sp.]